MTSQRPDLLTPEERELADRLGRIAPRGAPSADLDASILGAAHEAAGRKAAPARPRSRWPALAGIAATLALAIGVVWQLRPVREVPTERDEMPTSAVARSQPMAAASGEATPVPESDSGRPAESRTTAIATTGHPAEPQLRMMSPPAPKPLPPVVFDDPAPIHVPKPLPTPAAQAAGRPTALARAREETEPRAAAMQRKAAASASAERAANDAPADFNIDIDANQHMVTIADVPVDSDRLLDPADWIERIRQRRDSGDLDSARTSLDALRAAHPALALPGDVLAIGTGAATPPDR